MYEHVDSQPDTHYIQFHNTKGDTKCSAQGFITGLQWLCHTSILSIFTSDVKFLTNEVQFCNKSKDYEGCGPDLESLQKDSGL